jgi:hypothetical protein
VIARRPIGWWLLCLAACARPAPGGAADLARAYAIALAEDDPRPVYRMLSEATRGGLPEGAFAERWRATAVEREALAAVLRSRAGRPAETAEVRLTGERSAQLVREPEGWRLQTPRLQTPGATTPEEAVRRFRAALEERNFEALLRLLGEPLRSTVERELSARASRLQQLPLGRLQPHGDTLKVSYGNGYFIEIKKENGQWRVVDLN